MERLARRLLGESRSPFGAAVAAHGGSLARIDEGPPYDVATSVFERACDAVAAAGAAHALLGARAELRVALHAGPMRAMRDRGSLLFAGRAVDVATGLLEIAGVGETLLSGDVAGETGDRSARQVAF